MFIYHTHTNTLRKPGFRSIKSKKTFERQGSGQESEEIVKMFLAHLCSSVSILRMNNEPETGELNKNTELIWWLKEKKVTKRGSKNKCRQLTYDLTCV